jgi:hypothetical protein
MTATRLDAGLEDRLRQHVVTLATTPRPPGSRAHSAARAYIRTRLQSAGFTVIEETRREAGMNCATRTCNRQVSP